MTSFKQCRQQRLELSLALAEWFSTAPGSRVAENAREALSAMVQDLFGYHLLQVGDIGADLDYLSGCPVRYKSLVSLRRDPASTSLVVAEATHLPIASDCVDVVILPFALDFSSDPHQVLREAERVLIPEGRVVIVGFNPFSLWGLWRLVARWRREVPWCGHFLSYPRLNDWLTLMGCDIERTEVMEFRPPIRSAGLDVIERTGQGLWPMFAGVYVVRAVKRVSRITPVRPIWSRPRVLGSRAIEPTARESGHGYR